MKSAFTTGEAAKLCNVSTNTISKCIDRGLLKGFKVPGSTHRRVSREELVEFMKRHGMDCSELSK